MKEASFALKVWRAREHLNAFEVEARQWIETEPYTIVDEPDPEPPLESLPDGFQARRFRLVRIKPAPLRLSILIGDCLFNLRSALDHLALALARAHTPGITANRISKSAFPIFADSARYAQKREEMIGCLAPAAQDAIEKLQPYRAGDDPWIHPLWRIHNLNNIDKHRSLTVFAAMPIEGAEWRILHQRSENTVGAFLYFQPCDLNIDLRKTEIDAVYVRWAGCPIRLDDQMSMDPTAPTEVAFGDGPLAGEPVVPCLQSLNDFVGNYVVAPLARFL